jgi:formylmethanofuran dehydrogenase subunit E
VILATFPSKCPDCGEEIREGEEVGLVDDEWVCAACVADAGGEDDEFDD